MADSPDGRPPPSHPAEPPAEAAVARSAPPASPWPPCPCGSPLQRELLGLSAALSEKLDRLATALAGLSQEVAAVRTQVDRLGRRPRGSGPKGQAWPWTPPRGARRTRGPAHRHLPYWRHRGPARPRPRLLRSPAEGCRAGDPAGLSGGGPRLAPQLPADTPQAEPPAPSTGPSQQPPPSACSQAALTLHPHVGHTGGHQGPPAPSVPAALPARLAAPAAQPDTELLSAVAAPTGTLSRPGDAGGLWAGVQRALEGELWAGDPRDTRWGAPSRLHLLSSTGEARPPAPPQGQGAPSPGQTLPLARP